MGTDGNLYFSNALQRDSRQDYCCSAAFPRIRTMVQKSPMALVVVKSSEFISVCFLNVLTCLALHQKDVRKSC